MKLETALKEINKLRLNHKDKWYFYEQIIEGLEVRIKGYNTWLQIFSVNGINISSPMDITPTEFKTRIRQTIKVHSPYSQIMES